MDPFAYEKIFRVTFVSETAFMRTDFTFPSAVKQWMSRVQKYTHINCRGPSEPENLHAQTRWLSLKGRLFCREKVRRGSG